MATDVEGSWARLFDEMPRELFIPSVVWVDDPAAGGLVALSRDHDPGRWRALVESDRPIVTQVDDGKPVDGVGRTPTSSNSQPSLVARMLAVADLRPGQKALEIGTGTGWNAALMSSRVGPSGVVFTVEVDREVARAARATLARAGSSPVVIVGDGVDGYVQGSMYDRVVATAAVRQVPQAWIDQTKVGGVILTPWGTDYCNGALLRLIVISDGCASGSFSTNASFMRIRSQRREFLEPTATEVDQAAKSTTTLRGGDVYEVIAFEGAAFAIGLRVPGCTLTVEDDPDDEYRHIVELHDAVTQSWARVDTDPQADAFVVWQPRLVREGHHHRVGRGDGGLHGAF